MRKLPTTYYLLPALLLLLLLGGLGCRGVSREAQQATKPVNLVWWRVFDDPDSAADIINNYRGIHPNVSITYRKLRFEEYEPELLDALAEDRGPDIFSVHNTALRQYQSKLRPLPRELQIAYQFQKGSIKKETVVELRTERTLRTDQLRNRFVDQVAADVILPHRAEDGSVSDKIFGLPLALDTLVLYWNRDLLNTARIPEPARTWDEFLEHVKLLTKFDSAGQIVSAGAAIGAADNVERAGDILAALMMQNGTIMMEGGAVRFAQVPPGSERAAPPGLEALRFYTDFANPNKEAYTWNEELPNSLDAFTSGQVAYLFGYAYHLPIIKARAPKLNFGIAELPQVDPSNKLTFANYWVEGVSAKTKNSDLAWDFVQFAAAKEEQAKSYLAKTKKPAALRALIPEQLEDINLAVFAQGVLTAKSWYQGKDPAAAASALLEAVRAVVDGTLTAEEALRIAAGRVAQTVR